MSKVEMKRKLDTLRLQATETMRLNDSSRQHLYKTLAQTYLTWRELSEDEAWLKDQYRIAGIEHRNVGNRINFRPFIRLAFNINTDTGYRNNKVSDWSLVLNKLDEEYTSQVGAYRTNAIGKLAARIDALGGLTNIIAASRGGEAEAEPTRIPTRAQARQQAQRSQNDEEIQQRRTRVLSEDTETDIGTIKLKVPFRTDEHGLVSLIGKRNEDGSITILATTHEAAAIGKVVQHSAEGNLSLTSPSLKQLAEVIKTQMYPHGSKPNNATAARVWQQRIFYDRTNVSVSATRGGNTDERMTNPRRVLLRGMEGDIIISSMRSSVSVVTRCVPNNMLVNRTHNTYLMTNERGVIEEWIADGEIELLSAEPKAKLKRVDDEKHIYELTANNPITNTHRKLHFYEYGRVEDNPIVTTQTDFYREAYEAEWTTSLSSDWFVRLRADWLDEWFKKLGRNTQLRRENNFKIEMTVRTSGIDFRYNMNQSDLAPTHKTKAAIDMLSGKRSFSFEARSKDIAPVLYNLADLHVLGDIKASGNDHAVVFEFKTANGSYEIAVPTLLEHKLEAQRNGEPQLFYRID
jgi:hypothetical protein